MEHNQQPRLSDEEARQLLGSLFERGFGISGHRVGNGADYYQCHGCLCTKDILGYSDSTGQIDDVDHDPECDLLKLHRWCSDLGAEA